MLLPRALFLALLPVSLLGCFQATLNGPVAGASLVVTPLNNTEQVLFRGNTSTAAGQEAALGTPAWQAELPVGRVARLGNVEFSINLDPTQLYLVTASGGVDSDNNQDFNIDERTRQVKGQWRAIVRGDQMDLAYNNVSALTEAFYQAQVDFLGALTGEQIMARLDRLAGKVMAKDLNGDGVIDYADTLRWSVLYHKTQLKRELGDLDRLSLGIQEGVDEEQLADLANRFLGGKATYGLTSAINRKRDPDGTCDGRGLAVVADDALSVLTEPPTADCSDKDTGGVTATSGNIAAKIDADEKGFPKMVKAGASTIEYVYDAKAKKMAATFKSGNKTIKVKRAAKSPKKLTKTSFWYKKMGTLQGQSGVQKASNGLMRGSARSTLDDVVVDSTTFGTLLTSVTACTTVEVLAELEALGEDVPADMREWAISGCLSPLAEIEQWVSETSSAEVESLEDDIEPLQLDGCPNCYSLITSPREGDVYEEREIVYFNGLGPANATSVMWDFGDGTTSSRWSAQHAYQTLGNYTASFTVNYRNGGSGSSDVAISVVDAPGDCHYRPIATAGPDLLVSSGMQVTLVGMAEARGPAPCRIVSYQWSVVVSLVPFTINNPNNPTITFVVPDTGRPIADILLRLTITDSDGQTDIEDVKLRVQNDF